MTQWRAQVLKCVLGWPQEGSRSVNAEGALTFRQAHPTWAGVGKRGLCQDLRRPSELIWSWTPNHPKGEAPPGISCSGKYQVQFPCQLNNETNIIKKKTPNNLEWMAHRIRLYWSNCMDRGFISSVHKWHEGRRGKPGYGKGMALQLVQWPLRSWEHGQSPSFPSWILFSDSCSPKLDLWTKSPSVALEQFVRALKSEMEGTGKQVGTHNKWHIWFTKTGPNSEPQDSEFLSNPTPEHFQQLKGWVLQAVSECVILNVRDAPRVRKAELACKSSYKAHISWISRGAWDSPRNQ